MALNQEDCVCWHGHSDVKIIATFGKLLSWFPIYIYLVKHGFQVVLYCPKFLAEL